MHSKITQRTYFREQRSYIPSDVKLKYQKAIIRRLTKLIKDKKKIAIYAALNDEIDLAELKAKKLLLPKMQKDKTLKFYAANEELILHKKYKIYEPKGIVEFIPEVIICPMLAFDQNKDRLGYGGGYYDRTFKINHNALKIGVAYAMQECKKVTTDENDVSLDYIVTEKAILT